MGCGGTHGSPRAPRCLLQRCSGTSVSLQACHGRIGAPRLVWITRDCQGWVSFAGTRCARWTSWSQPGWRAWTSTTTSTLACCGRSARAEGPCGPSSLGTYDRRGAHGDVLMTAGVSCQCLGGCQRHPPSAAAMPSCGFIVRLMLAWTSAFTVMTSTRPSRRGASQKALEGLRLARGPHNHQAQAHWRFNLRSSPSTSPSLAVSLPVETPLLAP